MIASPLPSIDLDLDNVIIKPVQKAICQTSPLSGGRRRRAGAGGRQAEKTDPDARKFPGLVYGLLPRKTLVSSSDITPIM